MKGHSPEDLHIRQINPLQLGPQAGYERGSTKRRAKARPPIPSLSLNHRAISFSLSWLKSK